MERCRSFGLYNRGYPLRSRGFLRVSVTFRASVSSSLPFPFPSTPSLAPSLKPLHTASPPLVSDFPSSAPLHLRSASSARLPCFHRTSAHRRRQISSSPVCGHCAPRKRKRSRSPSPVAPWASCTTVTTKREDRPCFISRHGAARAPSGTINHSQRLHLISQP